MIVRWAVYVLESVSTRSVGLLLSRGLVIGCRVVSLRVHVACTLWCSVPAHLFLLVTELNSFLIPLGCSS